MSRSSTKTFIDACLAGEALASDIDDWVDRWHEGDVPDDSQGLDAFLGFTSDEGQLWAEKPEALGFILHAHKHDLPVSEVVSQYDQADYALAARSGADQGAADVFAWLVAHNRIRT